MPAPFAMLRMRRAPRREGHHDLVNTGGRPPPGLRLIRTYRMVGATENKPGGKRTLHARQRFACRQ